jgi:hypothetical protein
MTTLKEIYAEEEVQLKGDKHRESSTQIGIMLLYKERK